jgi:xanthine dehydrogenase accessory factor
MHQIAATLDRWSAAGVPFAVARVVETWSSAPRLPGAAMAVSADGDVVGSVSGGCVEAAVVELALEAISTGDPVLATYGVSDAEALTVGLTCGGVISVVVEPIGPDHPFADPEVRAALVDRTAVSLSTTLTEGAIATSLAARPGTSTRTQDGIFDHHIAARPTLILLGSNDFVRALAAQGRLLGYRVVVCDARPTFATQERVPDADEIVVDWPHRFLERQLEAQEIDAATVICVLTHDPKFDLPALAVALGSPAAYVGAMGSRRTDAQRRAALGVLGVDVARLSSPIGLDLAAATPEETALAVMAEIVMVRRGGTPSRLIDTAAAIHR